METIGDIAAGGAGGHSGGHAGGQEGHRGLLALLQETRGALQDDPDCLRDAAVRKEIEANVAKIVEKGRLYAAHEMTRDQRREKVLVVCDELQKLVMERLKGYETEMAAMKVTVKELTKKIRKLHKLLRKTVVDQVSDLFINSLNPINSMLAHAQRGKKQAGNPFTSCFN